MSASPNLLFILLDDLGWRDLACTGSPFYETPRIDQLAAEGMRFPNAYASCPVCSPTRASLLTGKYPATVGITQFIGGFSSGHLCDVPYFHELPESEHSLARALGEGGYQTWHVGKWHLGGARCTPVDHGFDCNIGGIALGLPPRGYFAPYAIETLPDGPDGEYLTDRLTDEAIRCIQQRDPARPFFLNLWHYAVHTPIQAPAELIQKYEAKAQALGLDRQPTFEEGEPFPFYHKRHQRIRRRLIQSHPVYAAMIENLDTNIGRLLDALDAAGLREETLVVLTSDNGGLATAEGSPTCNAPLAEGKGWMYEGGTREPLLVRWPGRVPAGSLCKEPVTTPDFYPTLLEAAGLPLLPEQHLDGVSLLPLFDGAEALPRDAIFWHYPHYSNQGGSPGCSVRQGPWKLIEFFENGHLELYHLDDDPGETRNLAAAEPARATALQARLVAWRSSVHARVPHLNRNWEKMRFRPVPTLSSHTRK